jgi:hypothetical protein
VRREDQEKINRFSRLHQREAVLEQQLAQKRVSFSVGRSTFCGTWREALGPPCEGARRGMA